MICWETEMIIGFVLVWIFIAFVSFVSFSSGYKAGWREGQEAFNQFLKNKA